MGDSDPKVPSVSFEVEAALNLAADGSSSLEDGLANTSIVQDNAGKDCELVGAIKCASVYD